MSAATEFSYDSKGNITSTKRWDSTKQSPYTYGQARSTASVTDVAYRSGSCTSPVNPADTNSTCGAIQQTTDPNGVVTTYDYSLNRCRANIYPNSISNGLTKSYDYDCRFGTPSQITDVDNAITSTLQYDTIGRLVGTSEGNGVRSTSIIFE